jgi:hypothetical protein
MVTQQAVPSHTREGVGLKVVSESTWYGSHAECDVCGSSSKARFVPRMVRYWDCDDGWTLGTLCTDCGEEAADRGPIPSDYAYSKARRTGMLDVLGDVLGDDLDGLWAEASAAGFDEFGE